MVVPQMSKTNGDNSKQMLSEAEIALALIEEHHTQNDTPPKGSANIRGSGNEGKLASRYFYVDCDGNQYRGLTEYGIIDDQLNGSVWLPARGDRRKVLRDGTYVDDPLEAGPRLTALCCSCPTW